MNKTEILQTELAKSEYQEWVEQQNYPAIAELLNSRPLIPNPVEQQTIWKCPTIDEIMTAVTVVEAGQLYDKPGLIADIRIALDSKIQARVEFYFSIVLSYNLLSAESQASLQALLTDTHLDPNYRSQILGQSKSDELGIYPVLDIDVQGALNYWDYCEVVVESSKRKKRVPLLWIPC